MQDEEMTRDSFKEDSLDDLQLYDNSYNLEEDFDPFWHNKAGKSSPLWRFFVMQCGICAIMIAIFGGIKLFDSSTFEAVKSGYIEVVKIEEDFKKDISDFLQSIKEKVDKLTPLHTDSGSESKENGESNAEDSSQQQDGQVQPPEDTSQEQQAQGEGGEPNFIAQADSVPANCSKNPITVPFEVTLPLTGKVTSSFGSREYPLNGDPDFHTGVDIAADEGTPIATISDGVVKKAGYCDGYGNYVKIEHAGGFISLYAHCSSLAVSEGQTVKKGQIIAQVGSTGASTGNHLHFGLQQGGIWYNPAYIFPEYK